MLFLSFFSKKTIFFFVGWDPGMIVLMMARHLSVKIDYTHAVHLYCVYKWTLLYSDWFIIVMTVLISAGVMKNCA